MTSSLLRHLVRIPIFLLGPRARLVALAVVLAFAASAGATAASATAASAFVERADQVVDGSVIPSASIVVSPDGAHAYTVTPSRDAVIGGPLALYDLGDQSVPRFRRAFSAAELGVDALAFVDTVISPDGRHLYAIDRSRVETAGVVAFERRADGELAYLDRRFAASVDTPDGLAGLDGDAVTLAISPDGRHVYVAGDTRIALFDRAANGRLAWRRSFEATVASDLVVSADGRRLWMAGSDVLRIYRRDDDGELELLQRFDDAVIPGCCGGTFSNHLQALPGEAVAVLAGADGPTASTELLIFDVAAGGGLEPVAGGFVYGFEHELLGVTSDADGTVYVARLLVDGDRPVDVRALRRDGSGLREVTRRDMSWSIGGALAIAPDGEHILGSGYELRSMAAFGIADLDGEGLVLTGPALDSTPGLVGPKDLVIAPDGRDLYVASAGAIAHLRHDGEDLVALGQLRFDEPLALRIETGHFDFSALSPDGSLMVTNRQDHLALARRDPDGSLAWIDQDTGLPVATTPGFAPIFSPDGRHLYLEGGATAYAVVGESLEAIDPGLAVGRLAFAPAGLVAWSALGSSQPGEVLERNPATGAWTLLGTTDPMERAIASPDGRHLVALRKEPGFDGEPDQWSLEVHAIESPTGLALVQERPLGITPSPLDESRLDLVFDPAGRFLYLDTSPPLAFRRDLASGRLAPVEILADGSPPELVDAFASVESLVVSPSGNDLYLARSDAFTSSVARLRRPCRPEDPRGLCLNGNRFRVEARWDDGLGELGDAGVTGGLDDSGLVWFFDEENWEMLVKVLDGCGLNDRFWVYAAATTDLGYRLDVTDTISGEQVTYSHTVGVESPAITDTSALAVCDLPVGGGARVDASQPRGTLGEEERLDLRSGRFEVEVEWRDADGQTGSGRVVDLQTDDSGLFYFFAEENWEMLVKVLDGCALNEHYWVFAAATTDVETRLRVLDTATGEERVYENPLGERAPAITDTSAFAGCS